MTLSSRIIADLIGKPYELNGRGPSTYDCAGLFVEIQRRLGVDLLIPPTPSGVEGKARAMLQILGAHWTPISQPLPGCCVFFLSDLHVGTMFDTARFVHTSSELGAAYLDSLDAPQWAHKHPEFYVPRFA